MLRALRVAIAAGHGDMSARQRKARFGVSSQGELGRAEPVDGVTVLTGRVCELGFVRVAVAIRTELVGHAVFRGRAGGLVAGSARHRGVASHERIGASGVGADRVGGLLPAIGGVAAGAISAAGASQELAVVHVFVADAA